VTRQRLCLSNLDTASIALLAALAALLVTAPLAAQTCPNPPPPCDRTGCTFAECATPAVPVPATYWGELQPATAACASLPGDSTGFQEVSGRAHDTAFFLALDTQNGFVFNGT
jgi:hypothetical protein